MDSKLDEIRTLRYSRHIMLPEVGEKGQDKLLNSKVLCIGSGGLGSPTIQYLAAAGVGTIGIIDDDVVDISNLQRQVIHGGNIGRPKVASAAAFVERLNPDVTVIPMEIRLDDGNVRDIIPDYDMVVDCSDNFATRFMINDACVLTGTPLSHGSIFKYEGQVITIIPGSGPCYRCIFERPPPNEIELSARKTGVLGVLPGVIGAIQATEVVKYLIGIGELLVGRMLYYDSLYMTFDEINIQKNPKCPVCGKES
ncbi:MAG: molybdopterin-synthase adenylyltransferase MoeB [Methanosarcinales archaeon]|nr:molybdopterin-synthase adenylyltransferase MoeB [Methanosarcinales archaeon]